MKITINEKELRELNITISDLAANIPRITSDRVFLSNVGMLLSSRGKQNLEDGGADGASYALLSPSTKKQKLRLGYSAKPLQRTGLLKRSIEYGLSGGVLYLTALDIAKHHHFGAPKANIPARPIFTLNNEDEEDVHDFLTRRFKELNTNIQ